MATTVRAQQRDYDEYAYDLGNKDRSYHLGLGALYSKNYWGHTFVGFNVQRFHDFWNPSWHLATDGANNGGAMLIGAINGDLQFVSVPSQSFSGAPPQDIADQDIPGYTHMVLRKDGQLQVGLKQATGNHKNYTLSVYGKITARSLYVLADNGTNWADYVFADDYKLPSLHSVERFVRQYKHLPEIPTTAEVAAQGIDVGQMNALLLKKVEELTLHLIRLEKQVKALQRRPVARSGRR